MKKYARGNIEIAEKNLTKLINNNKIGDSFKDHELFDAVFSLFKKIKTDFQIKKAKHVGNSYNSIGDLKLTLSNKRRVFLELKFLSSGRGTRANVSQDTLTKFNLFKRSSSNKKVLSWSDFRKRKKYYKKIRDFLNEFKYYPKKIKKYKKQNKTYIYKRARFLRKIISNNERKIPIKKQVKTILNNPIDYKEKKSHAARIIKNILNISLKNKQNYINYLKNKKQNKKNIKKLTFLIIAGYHTQKLLEEKWQINLSKIIKILEKEYYIYYIYLDDLKINKEDYSKKLRKILDEDMFIKFPDNQTNLLFCCQNKNILRVVFHWKNIFQGVKTPCLNIFDGKFLKK